MPAPRPPLAKVRRALELRAQHGTMEAARRMDMPPASLSNWIDLAPRWFVDAGEEMPALSMPANDGPWDRPPPEPPPPSPVKPHYRISTDRRANGEKVRVVSVGDSHDSPHIPDKSRFRWLGQYVAETKPDVLLQIGDLGSFDSLCRHEGNETLRGKTKPKFKDDLASLNLALDHLDDGLGNYRVEQHETAGNHDDRVFSFMNRTPEVADMLDDNLHTVLTDHRWTYSPYGALHFIGGVAFTHVPQTTMGKPYGGMHAENQIARDSLHSVVYGHSHRPFCKMFPKLGHKHIHIVNLGCFLPHGHIESYAQHSLTGWGYGFYDLTIRGGQITAEQWVPMTELEERYG